VPGGHAKQVQRVEAGLIASDHVAILVVEKQITAPIWAPILAQKFIT
jgi:hypothetical protein